MSPLGNWLFTEGNMWLFVAAIGGYLIRMLHVWYMDRDPDEDMYLTRVGDAVFLTLRIGSRTYELVRDPKECRIDYRYSFTKTGRCLNKDYARRAERLLRIHDINTHLITSGDDIKGTKHGTSRS